jgi:Protein of unknown function (DUF2924)
VLASANFSKELTTAVLWLRDRDIDIRCVRLQPYRMTYGSLSEVARHITGMRWNGPRFFGLRQENAR